VRCSEGYFVQLKQRELLEYQSIFNDHNLHRVASLAVALGEPASTPWYQRAKAFRDPKP
jgi:hypothetical protein